MRGRDGLRSGHEVPRELRPRPDAELGVDVGQVAGDSPLAEEECGGDFPVRLALSDQCGDTPLGRGQPFFSLTPADASELGTSPFDPRGRTELLKAAERRADRLAGGALVSCAPADDAEGKQRAGPPERIPDFTMLRHRLLQERTGATDIALRGSHETAASRHVREHPRTAEPRCVPLPDV